MCQGFHAIGAFGVPKPPVGPEDCRVWVCRRVHVHVVLIHAYGGSGRDDPLAVCPASYAVDAWEALNTSEGDAED